MELLFALLVGALTAGGIYLALRARTFPLVLGLTFLSYAVNLFLFAMGRLTIGQPPVIVPGAVSYTHLDVYKRQALLGAQTLVRVS